MTRRTRAWAAPVALGLATAALLAAGQAWWPNPDAPALTPVVYPFDPSEAPTADAWLAIAPEGNSSHQSAPTVAWETPHVGRLLGQQQPVPDDDGVGPRVGMKDHWSVNLTAYIFAGDGTLIASNDELSLVERFDAHPDFTWLPNGTWYLGAGRAPAGTRPLPEAVAVLGQDWLVGMKPGAVTTRHTDDYAWLWDRIWVTIRVDAIEPSPAP